MIYKFCMIYYWYYKCLVVIIRGASCWQPLRVLEGVRCVQYPSYSFSGFSSSTCIHLARFSCHDPASVYIVSTLLITVLMIRELFYLYSRSLEGKTGGYGVMVFWGSGVLGFWGSWVLGVMGFWGFWGSRGSGVLGFWWL